MHERAVVAAGELARGAGTATVDHDRVEGIVGRIRAREDDPEGVETFLHGLVGARHRRIMLRPRRHDATCTNRVYTVCRPLGDRRRARGGDTDVPHGSDPAGRRVRDRGGMLGIAPAVAQSSSDTPKATEIGVTAKEIHIAVMADVDNAARARAVQGRGRRRQGRGEVHQQQGRRGRHRRPQARGRLHRLAPERQRHPQRHHHRVSERLRDGRHVRAVPQQRRRRGQLQGPGRRDDRHPRPGQRGHRRSAGVFAGGVPGEPCAAGVQHQGRQPPDLQRQPVRGQVPAEGAQGRSCTAR